MRYAEDQDYQKRPSFDQPKAQYSRALDRLERRPSRSTHCTKDKSESVNTKRTRPSRRSLLLIGMKQRCVNSSPSNICEGQRFRTPRIWPILVLQKRAFLFRLKISPFQWQNSLIPVLEYPVNFTGIRGEGSSRNPHERMDLPG